MFITPSISMLPTCHSADFFVAHRQNCCSSLAFVFHIHITHLDCFCAHLNNNRVIFDGLTFFAAALFQESLLCFLLGLLPTAFWLFRFPCLFAPYIFAKMTDSDRILMALIGNWTLEFKCERNWYLLLFFPISAHRVLCSSRLSRS